ncbi:hypothetical protein Pcinc_002785 [Petrolisthes cinctipes]|uniref:Transposase n=2 Tax=Petrolisthes cinctipes TaxID=88211 RepID=A0AAE1L563_PETCI|nr:hypothetical protein Pcinc_024066 [Petrolisthes cinctipes]KAK3893350.1 hypothetical protein Pcinc_002785 [Petrolisthes cinctipes]
MISEATRGSIVSLHRLHYTNAQIARELRIAKPTVMRWVERYKLEGNLEARPRTGRPRCTTTQDDQNIKSSIKNDPSSTSLNIKEDHNLRCTTQTVRNRLHSFNLHARKPAKKPYLTEPNMEKRMEYSLNYSDKPASFWENVIFLDEKTFYDTSKATNVWRQPGTRYEAQHVVSDGRSGRIGVALFGWMHSSGVGELVDIGPGKFTGERYIDILENAFLPSVRILLYPYPEEFFLVQDNSPIHNCKLVKDWFSTHPEIKVLPHPPRSPDLNPIEHLWAAMERRSKEKDLGSRYNRASVVKRALDFWESLRGRHGQFVTQKMVESMPRRLNCVLEAGGSYTKY